MLLTATLYNRLGIPHLCSVHCELLLDCYSNLCPVEERLRAIGRRAFVVSQSGRYDEAISILEAVEPPVHKSLKFNQFLVLCIGLIKLRNAIRRYSSHLFVFLSSQTSILIDISPPDPTGLQPHTSSKPSSPAVRLRPRLSTPKCHLSSTTHTLNISSPPRSSRWHTKPFPRWPSPSRKTMPMCTSACPCYSCKLGCGSK